jgi:hypothetical protein
MIHRTHKIYNKHSTKTRSIGRSNGRNGRGNEIYQPSINQKLITLKTIVSNSIHTSECNSTELFATYNKLTPLQLYINKKCYDFNDPVVIKFMLYNLSANKHVNVKKLITPKQYDSNCWFNVMFVTFFISDKGRIFFHFLRQIMIEGVQQNGKSLSYKLWNIFALLNLYIELCKQGLPVSRKINTNKIILNLYKLIKHESKIYNKGEAGNPLVYYDTIISYLQNTDINILRIPLFNDWDISTINFSNHNNNNNNGKPPHMIIIEYSPTSKNPINRPIRLQILGGTYELDAACIIDIEREHFSSCLHIEGVEYMYDGMSQNRLFKRPWKHLLNSTETWSFDGSTNWNGTLKKWSFLNSYHSLHYYRIS